MDLGVVLILVDRYSDIYCISFLSRTVSGTVPAAKAEPETDEDSSSASEAVATADSHEPEHVAKHDKGSFFTRCVLFTSCTFYHVCNFLEVVYFYSRRVLLFFAGAFTHDSVVCISRCCRTV